MDVYPIRLEPGAEIKSFLLDFVSRHKIEAAFILTCCGSVNNAYLRFATDEQSSNKTVRLNEKMEITSLVGTISKDGAHLHATLGRKDGTAVSGHVLGDFIVHTTAEIVLGNATKFIFSREFDEKTGYKELIIKNNEL